MASKYLSSKEKICNDFKKKSIESTEKVLLGSCDNGLDGFLLGRSIRGLGLPSIYEINLKVNGKKY